MKIGSIQNNHVNSIKSKNHRVSFRSGLPNSFVEYVKHADVNKITTKLANIGFLGDFKGCKTVAACTEKTVEIFKKYNLTLYLKHNKVILHPYPYIRLYAFRC